MSDLQISVLGSLTVEVAHREVSLGGHRQQAVLASLLVRSGQPVSTDTLIDDLWGEEPPRTARNSVQRFVSDIRKALDDEGDRLETVDGGYRLRVNTSEVDALSFEGLLRKADRTNDPAVASDLLDRALGLWSGRPYEGVDEGVVTLERARLEELHATAEEEWARALLDLGKHHSAIPELERMVTKAPLREERWGLLMLALYRSGRQAEALRAFQRASAVLGEELGIEPSKELGSLEERIILQDASLHVEPDEGADRARTPTANPYKGLEAFGPADAEVFFGREEMTERLVDRVGRPGLTAVVGPSGSGKSSLVLAGLIPAIASGGRPGSDRWPIVVMRPGAHPFEELAVAAREPLGPTVSENLGSGDAEEVTGLLEQCADQDGGLLLVVDQFEELFARAGDETASRFMDTLVAAADVVPVVVTLRSDFHGRPLEHRNFAELFAGGLETVVPLSAGDLERAITGPAATVGVRFEPAVVAEMLSDVGDQPGGLPLLQYALTQLFEQRSDHVITIEDYDRVGGVGGALTTRAEEVWRTLGDEQRRVARQVLLRMVAVSEAGAVARRPMPLVDLDAMDDPVTATSAVDALVASRLLSVDRDPQTSRPIVEVAHEALLYEWGRLRTWIEEVADDLRTHRRLEYATAEWEAADRDPSFLLTGTRLDRINEWTKNSGLVISPLEREYVEASRARRRREQQFEEERRERELFLERRSVRRLRWLVAVMAVAFLTAVGLTAFALLQQREAEMRSAELSVRAIAATALAEIDVDPELGLLLAIEAGRASQERLGEMLPIAEQALHEGLAAPQPGATLVGGTAIDYSPDGELVAVARNDGAIEILSTQTAQAVAMLQGHERRVTALAFSPDGALLASASNDTTLRLWDVQSGFFLRALPHEVGVEDVAWHSDGTRIVTGAQRSAFLWDVAKGELVKAINVAIGGAQADIEASVGWLSDRLAVAAAWDRVVIWDADNDRLVERTFEQSDTSYCGLAVDRDASRIYLGDFLGGVQTMSVQSTTDSGYTAVLGERMVVHDGPVCALDVTGEGRWMHGGIDGRVTVEDEMGEEIRSVLHGGEVLAVSFSPDGDTFTSTSLDGATRLWGVDDPGFGELDGFGVGAPLVKVAIRDELVAASGGEGLTVRHLSEGSESEVTLEEALGTAVTIGPQGLIAFGPGTVILCYLDSSRQHSDPACREQELLQGLDGPIEFLRFNEMGSRLLGVGDSGDVVLWDTDTAGILGRFGTVKRVFESRPVVDVDTNKEAFVVIEDGSVVVVRSMEDGGEIIRFDVGQDLSSVAFESGMLAVGSQEGETTLWDTETGEPLGRLPTTPTTVMVFVPGSNRLITGSADGQLIMWDTAEGVELFPLPRSSQFVQSIDVSADGDVAVVGDIDGSVRVLALDPGLLLGTAEARAPRELTNAECQAYLSVTTCPPPPQS